MEVQPSYRTSPPGFRLHQKASSLLHHWADRILQETIDELELFEPFHEFDKSIQTHRSPAATDLEPLVEAYETPPSSMETLPYP